MCDWPIQHRPPSPVFRRLARKTCARGRKETGGRPVNICDHMGQCGIPPFPCSHSLVWCPSEDDVPFRCPLLPFPQPHWGVFLSLEMEGFWPSSTGPNVPPGCNGCCMPRHHSWTLPGVDKAYQKILPKMPCQRRYQMWRGWEHVAKRRRPGPIRLHLLLLYYVLKFFGGFFCLYIHIIQ